MLGRLPSRSLVQAVVVIMICPAIKYVGVSSTEKLVILGGDFRVEVNLVMCL